MTRSLRNTLLAVLILLPSARALPAQATFTIVDSTVRLQRYTTVEECIALGRRLRGHYAQRWDTSRYTNSLEIFLERQPDPPIAVAWTRQCMAKFDADTAPVDTIVRSKSSNLYWETGYVLARDFESARRVREKQLAVWPDSVLAEYGLSSRTELYRTWVRPLDLGMLDALDSVTLRSMERRASGTAQEFHALRILWNRMRRRLDARQRDSAKIRARELLAFIEQYYPAVQRQKYAGMSEEFELSQYMEEAWNVLEREALLDSLRVGGPESYERTILRRRPKISPNPMSFVDPIGKPAKPIAASFIFPFDPKSRPAFRSTGVNADTSVPASGKVTLLLFLNNACRLPGDRSGDLRELRPSTCWEVYGAIRRLAKKFPTLDITVVAQTLGLVGPRLTTDSAEEANLIRELWHDYHKLPINIAVTYTPYQRIEAPDNRRVDGTMDYIKYYFTELSPLMSTAPSRNYILVTPERKILAHGSFSDDQPSNRNIELDLQELLTPLMEWYDRRR